MIDELRERLAAEQHEIWVHCMEHIRYWAAEFHRKSEHDDLHFALPEELIERWRRQMNTSYADLPEEEKGSSRYQADKIISVLAEGPIVMPLVYEHDRMRIALESIGAKVREALED